MRITLTRLTCLQTSRFARADAVVISLHISHIFKSAWHRALICIEPARRLL